MTSAAPTPADVSTARSAELASVAETGPVDTSTAPRTALELAPWLARYPRRPATRRYHRTKRALDVTAVAISTPLWAPLYAACALAVKLDSPSGPVHFAQERTGIDGRRFRLHKLRTMVPDAEERKAQLAHLNERDWPDFKITNDPRITRVGRFLRATSLDELPQLVNVAKGELSLVGPRPWSKGIGDHEVWHVGRYAVPAGLTGLWQIAGRDAGSFTERIRLDLAYAQRRCLKLDLELLARTVPAILGRRGA